MNSRKRAEEIFLTVVERDRSDWELLLESSCGGDVDLRAEVEALLAADADDLELVDPRTLLTSNPGPPEFGFGTRIGPYRIGTRLGEGGFGVVHRAEQELPIRRAVAIKVIKLGMDSRRILRRFERERQLLASMNHPHVARIYDAGITETGRPYFVMELVEGEPITSYCDRHALTIEARLELLLQVCEAVHHTHRRGTIHRDLKPSNVLVSTVDDAPAVKVIDFGIACAVGSGDSNIVGEGGAGRDGDVTGLTEPGQLLGTPEYMSPEQATGNGDIDTRTDVYALGVLMYELLTGGRPFDFGSAPHWPEIQRVLRDEPPERPSTRFSRSGERSVALAASRAIDPGRLRARLRGDLDWIVTQALAKEPDRRYSGVDALADDIARHLAGAPVHAAPPSRTYRFRKLVERHRVASTAIAATVLALLLGSVGTTWGMLRARSAEADQRDLRHRAEIERDRARAVALFLRRTFAQLDPELARTRDTTLLAQLLDDAASRMERREWAGDANAELELRLTIGGAYGDLGRYDDAERIIAPAVERASRDVDLTSELRTWAFARGASVALARRDFERAATWYRAALDLLESQVDASPTEWAAVHAGLGHIAVATRDWDEAVRQHEASLAWAERAGGREEIKSLGNLAATLRRAGRVEEALVRYASLDPLLESSASDDPTVASLLSNRGALRSSLGDGAGARDDFARALAIHCAVVGREHPAAVTSRHNLAYALADVGQIAESEALLRECLDIERDRRPDGPAMVTQLQALATLLARRGEFEGAIECYEDALVRARRESAPAAPSAPTEVVLEVLLGLAQCQRSLGRMEVAEATISDALSTAVGALAPHDPQLAHCYSVSGQIARDAGHGEQAIERFRRAVELRRATLPPDHPVLGESFVQLGVALVAADTLDAVREAEPLLRDALERRRSQLAPGNWKIASAEASLGAALARRLELAPDADRHTRRSVAEEAERLLRDGYVGLERERTALRESVRAQRLAQTARAVARLYESWSRLELGANREPEAREWSRIADEWE